MVIFLDDRDYRRFIDLLHDVCDTYSIDCWNYCVMPNHYHATLRPKLPNISAAMKSLNSNYAQWWNRRHEKVGHVFQGRFKAQVVQREEYALALARYVALNPVRAGLVKDPGEWPWSSFAATVGRCSVPPFLCADATLALFGGADRETLQKRFAEFVTGCPATVIDDRIRSSSPVL